ncbi:MAG: hypothetical protein J5965_06280 [Aeriscardovia sp.]|nr:hypothetical protein [Prevotella sp.]MBO5628673.1 hypothetical protein [Aeriscardovia sp.]
MTTMKPNHNQESRTSLHNSLRFVGICLLLLVGIPIFAQNQSQADLLERAYIKHSKSLLYKFFDNWSNEVSSNENDAPNKWVAEAHKVFAAFYQPLQPEKIGCRGKDVEAYYKSAYLIVQDTLNAIYTTDSIPLTQDELESFYINRAKQQYPDSSKQKEYEGYIRKRKKAGELRPIFDISRSIDSYLGIPTAKVDSNISFRPPVSFPNKKVVYLTTAYKQLLNNFLGNEHVRLGEESVMQVAYSKGESAKRMEYINKAVKIIYGHWGGYWQYETYPKAYNIILDSKLRHAVVNFRYGYGGGYAILKKQNNQWTIISAELTWIE